MEKLVDAMVQSEPSLRPNMDDVVTQFSEITLSKSKLSSPLLRQQDVRPVRFIKSVLFYGRNFFSPSSSPSYVVLYHNFLYPNFRLYRVGYRLLRAWMSKMSAYPECPLFIMVSEAILDQRLVMGHQLVHSKKGQRPNKSCDQTSL
jgi:hypothetical protein